MDTLPSPLACGRFMHMDINTSHELTNQGEKNLLPECWCTRTGKHGPHRLFHTKALGSLDLCPRIVSQEVASWYFYVNGGLFLYLHFSFHHSWSPTTHLFEVLGLFVLFFLFCFFKNKKSIILSSPTPNKLTPSAPRLPPPHLFGASREGWRMTVL